MTDSERQLVAKALVRVLADAFVLSYKIRHLCWRLQAGPAVDAYGVIKACYGEIDTRIDPLAREIVSLGGSIPPDFAGLVRRSSIKHLAEALEPQEALRELGFDHLQFADDIDHILQIIGDEMDMGLKTALQACNRDSRRCADAIAEFMSPPDATTH